MPSTSSSFITQFITKKTCAKVNIEYSNYAAASGKQTSVITWIHSNIWSQNTETKP